MTPAAWVLCAAACLWAAFMGFVAGVGRCRHEWVGLRLVGFRLGLGRQFAAVCRRCNAVGREYESDCVSVPPAVGPDTPPPGWRPKKSEPAEGSEP